MFSRSDRTNLGGGATPSLSPDLSGGEGRRVCRAVVRGLVSSCAAVLFGGWLVSCDQSLPKTEVVLYTSVDQPVAQKVIDAFSKKSGVSVRLVTDTEATKSVGLAERLRAEKANPLCHVWWGNEVFHTIALADEGLFQPLAVQSFAEIETQFKDAQLRWGGSGLRLRVMAVSENAGQISGSIQDLLDPRFKGKVALARPVVGTTAGHVSALYALWGQEKADGYFRKLRDNGAIMVGGNSVVAEQVGKGNMLLGLTDNDDIISAQRAGGELWEIVPDQNGDSIGTLAIPTTVALIARHDQPDAAKQLAEFLLSKQAEQIMIDDHFVAASTRSGPGSVKVMKVSYAEIAKHLRTAPQRAANLLDGREP
jgi:iron(III) transport system substrate-binding protein